MRKQFKRIAIVLLVLAGFVLLFVLYIQFQYEAKKSAKFTGFTLETIELTNDSAILAHGERLSYIKGCRDCHGKQLEGKNFLEMPDLGLVKSTNLTGRAQKADWQPKDWLLALKHGVDQNYQPLFIMPAHETALLSKRDMTALISYLHQLPATGSWVERKVDATFLLKMLSVLGEVPAFNTHKIDHQATLRTDVVEEVSTAYGAYLSVSCIGCHRDNLKGGDPVVPGFPPVPDITSSGLVGKWSFETFKNTLRFGKTPEGKILNPEQMPWPMAAKMTDMELEALYIYLQSI